MIFIETELPGSFVIDPERLEDARGFFARVWCRREFEEHEIAREFVQCNISYNKVRGTLRGMHFQSSPHAEDKLIRCTRGAIHDVIIDLRPDSPTFKRHVSVVLSADNRKMAYVPAGFAHGFLTLDDDTEVFYQMSQYHSAEHAAGVRWNDPTFGIQWPGEVTVISDRDRAFPDFQI